MREDNEHNAVTCLPYYCSYNLLYNFIAGQDQMPVTLHAQLRKVKYPLDS